MLESLKCLVDLRQPRVSVDGRMQDCRDRFRGSLDLRNKLKEADRLGNSKRGRMLYLLRDSIDLVTNITRDIPADEVEHAVKGDE